ncbi:hypothetical protein MRX96_013560 [Rhipicephalus microplus]
MKHTKRAKASNGKALDGEELVDWVQCLSCERWLERSDTPFETTQEAEADSSFLCRICERMRVMREQSQLQYKQESERWQLALDSLAARLEAHIVNSKNERDVLLDKLAEERRLRGALLEQVGALQRALDIIDADKTSSHENTSATRRVEVTKSAKDVSDVRNSVKAAAVDAGREIVQSQNKPNSDQELLGGDDRNAVKAVAVDAGRVIDQSQNKPNSDQELVGGSPAEAVGWQVKRSKRAQKRLRKERAEDSQASIPSSRKKTANGPPPPPERPAGLPGAFVYVDGNARRLKRAVLQASAWHRGIQQRPSWFCTPGLSDIQDDTSPHDSTEKIKSQITSWKARAKGHFFVVYGVPEVGPKDDTMRIKCELWNQNLRQICSDIGTRVEFVSVTKALQDKMNGTSYSEYVAEQLGQRLGRRLCAFLGPRPSGNYKHRAWRVKPTISMMTALGQAILQMANPQRRQKRSWHRT